MITTFGPSFLRNPSIVNVASVPQWSPLRYPGGKTWLYPWSCFWLRALSPRPRVLVEPFAGGASVGLAALFDGLIDHIVLIEMDDDVASFWRSVLGPDVEALNRAILEFDMSTESIQRLELEPDSGAFPRGLATLVRNRTRYGGILAAGAAPMRQGENGRGLASRWYPETLVRRIRAISARRHRITFVQGDGLVFLERAARYQRATFFIDPPYTVTGQRLYTHCDIDHERVFAAMAKLRGAFLTTYDDCEEIRGLAQRHGLRAETVPMKSTKHEVKRELLISRDFEWLTAPALL